MANPQLEDGYFKIATILAEHLAKIRIPGEANQLLWAIFRFTYGWHKKSDQIALSQLCEMTKLSQSSICRARNTLLELNLIIVYKDVNGRTATYSFQKDYEKWKPFTKKKTFTKTSRIVDENVNNHLRRRNTPKIIKDNKDNTADKPAKTQNSNHQKVIDYYCQSYEKHFEIPYTFKGGKDGDHIKQLLKTWKLPRLVKIIDQLFRTHDEFVEKAGRTIGVLYSCIDKLAQEAKLYHTVMSQRQAIREPPRAVKPDLTPEKIEENRRKGSEIARDFLKQIGRGMPSEG